MVKAVIFDCFGVLVRSSLEPFFAEYFSDNAEKMAAAHEVDRAASAGEINYDTFAQQLADLAGIPVELAHEKLNQTPPNEPLLAYIRDELKPHYKIGFLSNASDNWLGSLFTPDQQTLFDDAVLSYQHRLAKPDARIYELAAERLGVAPTECVFVDDLAPYCEGARAVGMQAVQYKTYDQTVAALQKLLSEHT